MMAKMYYSEPETCEILGLDVDGLMEFVNSGRLQMYQDGPKHVYKASDVDSLKDEIGTGDQGEDDIALATDGEADAISLADVDIEMEQAPEIKKEDTVITAAGISIFDDEDLEIEEADPMAATQIAPSLDDQVALDGIGSGSGLLDLTRESDDTSLGVEVLDHIDMEGGSGLSGGFGAADTGLSGMGTGLSGEFSGAGDFDGADMEPAPVAYEPQPTEPPVFVEPIDASSGFFSGMLVTVTLVSFIMVIVMISAFMGNISSMLQGLRDNSMFVVIGGFVAALIFGVIGLFIGKSMKAKNDLLEKMSR